VIKLKLPDGTTRAPAATTAAIPAMTPAQLAREAGVEAIMHIQAISGIRETREHAATEWDQMTKHERWQTMRAYELFGPEEST
jgi:hypothetical protein